MEVILTTSINIYIVPLEMRSILKIFQDYYPEIDRSAAAELTAGHVRSLIRVTPTANSLADKWNDAYGKL